MNIGIYLQSLSDHAQLQSISKSINKGLEDGTISDASLFFDSVAFNPFKFQCGLFNSTDLWNFNGTLITTSLSTTLSAIRIVNNIKIYYYYGLEKKISPLSLLYLTKNNNDLKFVATNEQQDKDLYRKTGQRSLFVSEDFETLVKNLG